MGMSSAVGLLAEYLLPLRRKVTALFVVLIVAVGLELFVPLILQRYIDTVIGESPFGEGLSQGIGRGLLILGLAYLLAGVLNQVASAVGVYLSTDLGWTATNRLREDLTRHLLRLDMGFHTGTTPGEMIERVDGDVTAVANFVARFVVRILTAVLLLFGVVVVAWQQSVAVGLGYSAFVVVVLVTMWLLRNLGTGLAEQEREVSALLYGFIEERLAAIDDIRANGAGPATMVRFGGVMRAFFFGTTAAWRRRNLFRIASNALFWVGSAVMLGYGVWLVTTERATVGTAYLLYQYVLLIQGPVEQVTQQFAELQKAFGGIVRIEELRQREPAIAFEGRSRLPDGPLEIEFADVSFSYGHHRVLHDMSFTLAPGTVLGLLGRTGGGKTTTTRLIARLHDPEVGQVRIGGLDLCSVERASLRRRVGSVPQDVQLMRGTVRENLTFFDRSIDDATLLGRLDRAGLGEWIRSLGLDTMLGAEGSGLSAGESQLLAFARVFLHDPGVVILDEPSSRVDPATEAALAEATERLFENRTVVIIAHRLETVRSVDQIMIIDEGRIVEHGSRLSLASQSDSRYANLLAASETEAAEELYR